MNQNNLPKSLVTLIIVGIVAVILLVVSFFLFDIATVRGNEIGVKETWSEGVIEEALFPKTYILFPGFMQEVYNYDISSQVFVMNDTDDGSGFGAGRKRDSYTVQSREGQDMRISLSVRWRINPDHIVQIHKTVRNKIEEKLLRPELMRIVKDEATLRTAIDAYSGQGLVKLQSDIFNRLTNTESELQKRGIVIENFVIENIGLDREYIGQIKARQVAVQRELRAREETKAAMADAEKAKAVARAAFEKAVVDAKRDKEVGVLSAQKKAEQEVLAAEANAKKVVLAAKAGAEKITLAAQANKEKTVLSAEGEKEAGELRAQAILAIGTAEAQATKLKLSAYAVPGADAFVQIEVAKQMAIGFGNIKGYLPGDMKINLLSESFLKSVQQITAPRALYPKQ